MANILDSIKKFLNTCKIKSSEKQYSNMQSVFESNLEQVKEATCSVNISPYFMAHIKPVEAARYCVTTHEEGRPFYVLTYGNGGVGKSAKRTKEVTEAVLSELKAYLNAKDGANEKKAYYNAAAAVLSQINEAIGSDTLIGFVSDKTAADGFIGCEYSFNTSAAVLNDVWSSVKTTTERLDILRQVLGEKKKVVPSSIMGLIVAHDKPFDTIYWKIIKHQTQYDEPIDEEIFKMIREFSEFRAALKNGDCLNGLNFGKKAQFNAILSANALGEEYIDQLRTAHGWLGEAAMEEKEKEFKEIMKQKNIISVITPGMKEEIEQKKKLIEKKKAEERDLLQKEIVELKTRIKLMKTGPDAYEFKIQQRVQALEEQCQELERRLRYM